MKLFVILSTLVFSTISFAQTEKVMIDTAASNIHWKGGKEFTDSTHEGNVAIKSGYVEFNKGNIVGGEIIIDMNAIVNTDIADEGGKAKLVGHLQNADFFETDKYPTATFKIKKAAKGNASLTGDLTIKGKTQPATIKTTVVKEGDIYTAKGTTNFDRTKFGVQYNSKSVFPDLLKSGKDKVIKNNIDLQFDLKTVAAAPAAKK